MDMLGGYSSEGSEGSSSSVKAFHAKVPIDTGKVSLKKIDNLMQPSKIRRAGKRLVSLHAVLPQSIRDRLTRTTDSDSDDDDNHDPSASQLVAPKTSSVGTGYSASDFSSLLTELKSTSKHVDRAPEILRVVPVPPDTSKQETQKLSDSSSNLALTTSSLAPKPQRNRQYAQHQIQMGNPNVSLEHHSEEPQATGISVPRMHPTYSENYVDTHQEATNEESKNRGYPPKKRCRKEMERALRSGNLDVLDQCDTITLNSSVTSFQPNQMSNATSERPQIDKVVNREDLTSTQKSKHQIHQLVSNAAQLEMHRARSAQPTSGKSSRAGARQKYGW